MRIGVGFDLHRLGADRPLRLAGVEVSEGPGLIGHSDADCVLHAITDALLGAGGTGLDIGALFPDDDPEFLNADSAELLNKAMEHVPGRVVNVDCMVLAERPKLAPHREAMRERIASLLGIDASRVGVKATTMERLGPIGEGKAIACHAVVLLEEDG
ncbi:MAG: 2-C-methyl-D-erythritol 2,4-cyclodiphosphate synthase [Planctomycetota bacterium]|jgi:2-C-methyl-D-erythritol 2,4-cyclodiphosphate synthase